MDGSAIAVISQGGRLVECRLPQHNREVKKANGL